MGEVDQEEVEEFERIMRKCMEATGQSREELFREWKEWDREMFAGLLKPSTSLCLWAINHKRCVPRGFCANARS